MSGDDLPLFRWQPPVKVILFPLVNRVGKVRHTAHKLFGKRGEEADLYWKQIVAANRKHLARVGVSDADIDDEIREFFAAVQGELNRLTYEQRGAGSNNPRGAA